MGDNKSLQKAHFIVLQMASRTAFHAIIFISTIAAWRLTLGFLIPRLPTGKASDVIRRKGLANECVTGSSESLLTSKHQSVGLIIIDHGSKRASANQMLEHVSWYLEGPFISFYYFCAILLCIKIVGGPL
jgi:hypothetical protein